MKTIVGFFIVIGLVGLITGTGCKTTMPVILRKDSVVHIVRDSVIYRETATPVVRPERKVTVTLSREQLDSVFHALALLPVKARQVIYQDAPVKTQLKILLDSVGKIKIECAALAETYYNKTVEQQRLIKKLQSKYVEKEPVKPDVKEKRGWWATVNSYLTNTTAKLLFYLVGILLLLGFFSISIHALKKWILGLWHWVLSGRKKV